MVTVQELGFIFVFTSLFVPALTIFVLPKLVNKYTSRKGNLWLLVAAGALFFISNYLPSPYIEGRDTSAVTHFIGGGIYSALVWLYLKERLGHPKSWFVELASLLALTSLLGTANELFELFIVKANLYDMPLDDTNWDLLMNTLGALLVFGIYKTYDYKRK
ncbi:MAG TPA: hypothetical protein PK096_00725 [Candidatus Saccharibacteria bacterium]|mgnify:CR=1 FL=1|nr:hypothetical protein [Candidatus Saccharibacteria bacterium]HRK93877.1 hypothetical protein [Candidatus Saccharibacteria bacterium]